MSIRGFTSRVFGSGENPFRWAIPVYRLFGIDTKIHVFFVVYILVQLLATIPLGAAGVGYVALILGALFLLVLLHEYGHCFACRFVRGEADEIILWPLGGLAMCRPPHEWRAHLITTAGGPAVNAVLLLPLGAACWLATGTHEAAIFNPFEPSTAFAAVNTSSTALTWLLTALIALHFANAVLLAFNVLVPMYPMDGGRLLQAALWSKLGYHRSMDLTCLVGFGGAGVLAVIGLVFNQTMLLAIAAFGGITCWQARRQLSFGADAGQDAFAEAARQAEAIERRERAEARKRREAAILETEQIDRILEKIAKQGMGSLTKRERRMLDAASEKGRGA
ncbi:MAG: DUF6576 domain-containing protein [Planctomycetota bacterium]